MKGIPTELGDSYRACAEITRRRARNFFYGLRLAPEPRRSALYAIYAWMRAADDAVDQQADLATKQAALARHSDLTERVLTLRDSGGGAGAPGATPTGAYWPAFAHTLASYPIDGAHVRDMLRGMEDDLTLTAIRTDADLERYCYRVASTVGQVCVAVWGLRPGVDVPNAMRLAALRGRAFQLTNILRDFAQDFDDSPSRVYLPRSAFDRAGLDPTDLRRWAGEEACATLIRAYAGKAREAYEESSPLDAFVDPACAPAMWAMTSIYRSILDRIEAEPRRVVSPTRIRLPSWKKLVIAFSASLRARRASAVNA
ncbi:MAG: phytoene/squalene synthase family protein [Phycisphaerae bacterium]|nr:phytoene/squalene synthase family protein [Phycisphaerae bacterium]